MTHKVTKSAVYAHYDFEYSKVLGENSYIIKPGPGKKVVGKEYIRKMKGNLKDAKEFIEKMATCDHEESYIVSYHPDCEEIALQHYSVKCLKVLDHMRHAISAELFLTALKDYLVENKFLKLTKSQFELLVEQCIDQPMPKIRTIDENTDINTWSKKEIDIIRKQIMQLDKSSTIQ